MSTRPLVLAALALLSGCAALQRDAIGDQENLLAAAGFTVRGLDSPARAEMVGRLPPNRISQLVRGSNVSYLYPDPVNCRCLYAGDQAAYGRLQQITIQRNIARDQVAAAQLNTDFGWDWGPWGGWGPGFYP